ncbi:MAG: zf-HC2 domain-containing protein [Polyangia bacterium]
MKSAVHCEGVWRFCDAFVDGEFGDVERAEFESHLEGCHDCQAIVRAQATWKQAVRAAAPREKAPDVFRARLDAQLAREVASKEALKAQVDAALGEVATVPPRSFVSRAWPYAACGCIALALLVTRGPHAGVTADLIAKHQRNLPIEISGGSDNVRRWYADKVDFPVRPPVFVGAHPGALRGGRLANVRDHQAAYLFYEVDGNKVSVFIFDAGELPMEARHHQVIGNREVYFDAERGYNVALYRDHGVGYAIASDLDQDQMMKLVSSAVSH